MYINKRTKFLMGDNSKASFKVRPENLANSALLQDSYYEVINMVRQLEKMKKNLSKSSPKNFKPVLDTLEAVIMSGMEFTREIDQYKLNNQYDD